MSEYAICQNPLSPEEQTALLSVAVILLNCPNPVISRFGYTIVLRYCNHYDTYEPLHEVALNLGFIPIAMLIEATVANNLIRNGGFFTTLMSSYIESFKEDSRYFTAQQQRLYQHFQDTRSRTLAVIAPTSYGKTELIISHLNTVTDENVCIIVPTKALLAQTKRRVLSSEHYSADRKIITHPEMYVAGDAQYIAILTQERLLRLLQQHRDVVFDTIFVDEAHNLLSDDSRNLLLAFTIACLERRNASVAMKFLTPFLMNPDNLKVRHTEYEVPEFRITEHLKIERFHAINMKTNRLLKLYDQYLDRFIPLECSPVFADDIDFIQRKAGRKSIIYLNKPPDITRFALALARRTSENPTDERLAIAISEISNYVHHEYHLLDCLRCGIVFHHGSMPDNLRLYVEKLYTDLPAIKYIVTSSTLLEGVNIPGDTLFILDYFKGPKKLSPSQFLNLSGRICRFGDIFSESRDLKLLEPNVYVIGSNYLRRKANIEKFLRTCTKADMSIREAPDNVAIKNTVLTGTSCAMWDAAETYLCNLDTSIRCDRDVAHAQTAVGRSCFANGVMDFDILACEQSIQDAAERIADTDRMADTANDVLDYIATIFMPAVPSENRNLLRLLEPSARRFYSMFLNWRVNSVSYTEMVASFLGFWSTLRQGELIYAGRWGDCTRGDGRQKLWTNISEKSNAERINLAIVRVKDEQDFVDNEIMKYVEVLHDLRLIAPSIYLPIKYGTGDPNVIELIKNGIGLHLAKLLLRNYVQYLSIERETGKISISAAVLPAMQINNENGIDIFEAEFHVTRE